MAIKGIGATGTGAVMLRRVLVYLLGNFLVALGVIVSVKSRLGISPVQSIPFVCSRIFEIDQGLMTTFVYSGYILLQIILLRRAFPVSGFLQILISIIFGYFVFLCSRLLSFPDPASYPLRLLLLLTSVLLIAFGLFFYLAARLIPQPSEGLILAIEKLSGWGIPNIKIAQDCAMVAAAVLISFVFTGSVMGVREGTLVSMLGVGRVLGVLSRFWRDDVSAFCFGGRE